MSTWKKGVEVSRIRRGCGGTGRRDFDGDTGGGISHQGGVLHSPSSYFMKHPPKQVSDSEAYELVNKFIQGEKKLFKVSHV